MTDSSHRETTIRIATDSRPAQSSTPPLADWLVFIPVVLVHVLFDVAIQVPLVRQHLPEPPESRVIMMGVGQAQASILAVWLSRGRWATYVRYGLGIPLLLGISFSMVSLLPLPIRHGFAPLVFLGLAIQSVLITTTLFVVDWFRNRRRLSFDLASAIGWTAVVAVGLGLFRATHVEWEDITLLLFEVATIAATNAAMAIAIMCALLPHKRRIAWAVLAFAACTGLAFLQLKLIRGGIYPGLPTIALQMAVVSISLLLIRRQLRLRSRLA